MDFYNTFNPPKEKFINKTRITHLGCDAEVKKLTVM